MSDTFRAHLLQRLYSGGHAPPSGPQPHRTPADVALGSPLGGPWEPSLYDKMNPTNLQTYVAQHPYLPVPPSWEYPYWDEPDYRGSSEVKSREKARMANMQVAERQRAGEQMIAQVSAGSVNPIYYPPPTPVPPAASHNDRGSVLAQHRAPTSPYSGPGGYGGTTPGSVPVEPTQKPPPDALLQFLRGLQGR